MDENEVILAVEGQKFQFRKSVLCRDSDYFRAMFSADDREFNEKEIGLDIDIASMKIIRKYIHNGIDVNEFSEYPLHMVGKFAEAANMLQFKQLSKIIESYLELQAINVENWLKLTNIAQNYNYTKLKKDCADFGVPTLKEMKPQYVTTIQELVWYISQSRLYVLNEYDVFKYALDWMSHSNSVANPTALLMFLGCLDMKRITTKDFIEIKTLCLKLFGLGFSQSLAGEVVNCLTEFSERAGVITAAEISTQASHIKEKYSEAVYLEVLELVESSRRRQVEYIPVLSVLRPPSRGTRPPLPESPQLLPHSSTDPSPDHSQNKRRRISRRSCSQYCLYIFKDSNLYKWLQLKITEKTPEHDYTWSIAAWGLRKLVVVISIGKGRARTKLRVYDVLKNEWVKKDEIMPTAMVRKSAVVGDLLYLLCSQENMVINLKTNALKKIAKLPFTIANYLEVETRMPLTCVHNEELYVSNLKSIHRYDETDDVWVKVIDRHISNMVSNDDGYMYVTDTVSNTLCRFRPGIDVNMEAVLHFGDNCEPIINVCPLGDRLLFFTSKSALPAADPDDFRRTLFIHEYDLKTGVGKSDAENSSPSCLKEVWSEVDTRHKFDPYRNVVRLLFDEPYIDDILTTYLQNKLRIWKE